MESTVVGADVFRTGCLGYVIHCHLHSFCSPVIICRTYNDHLVYTEFINYDPSSNAQKRLRDICVKVNHEISSNVMVITVLPLSPEILIGIYLEML